MLKKFIQLVGGDPNKREIERLMPLVRRINALEATYEAMSDEELRGQTERFRQRLAEQTRGITDPLELFHAEQVVLDELLPEAFAAVREASKRTIGLRHYDVQLIGGIVLHKQKIAEMRTGEGKTLVATLPLYLNALAGHGVHLVTVNDYLARRDARWMAPIYDLLGMSVGVLQIAARTENGKKAFLVDLQKESPHEDQHQLRMVPRQEAYAADITYGTNSEFGFDYLRDNMTMRLDERVQRGHYYAIVDEVDNILIDEARTPLIISGPAQDESEGYLRASQVVRQLRPEDYEVDEKNRTVTLTELGEAHVEELLGMQLRDPERPEDATPEQARMLGYLEQSLRAHYLYRRNKDYIVQAGKVIIVDEFTGRLMPGRRWSDGLHQAVEAKEGVKVQSESVTYATITIQNYFRMYKKLAGMTGTAMTEAEEFDKIYNLGVVAIPTNLEYIASLPDSPLIEVEGRDEQGYKFTYYARKDDPEKTPVYYKRKDYPDVVYRTEEAKLRAICREILRFYVIGRPVLVGTTSVELSERLSSRLRAEPLRRLAQVLLLRDAFFRQHGLQEDGRQIAELQFLNTPLDKLNADDLRKLARELKMALSPDDPANLESLGRILEVPSMNLPRLQAALQGGVPHQVLNARKHTEESQIIAGAGAFGAVTIATNMAGRGVDIKLGGELAEEILASVNRVLARNGYPAPYDMSLEERRKALLSLDRSAYGIYESEIDFFLAHLNDMELVRELGGLHVIGSERHEARRIDNQLRGRAARQGDPGSSRFYLSMEDPLMRLFGGQQADAMMQRLKIDDALPLEVGLVGRLVEGAQNRVEGANFDVRKHLLEYDDVLNAQRAAIYAQRDRIFTKEDLSEDVTEMLRTELSRRVPEALRTEGGPWKLLAWLEQVQPPLVIGLSNNDPQRWIFPSFTMRLLLEEIKERLSADSRNIRQVLLELSEEALEAERQHFERASQQLLDQAEERLEEAIADRLEALDTFFEGLEDEEAEPLKPNEILNRLVETIRIPIRPSPEVLQLLRDNPRKAREAFGDLVRGALNVQAITRLVGAFERRLDEPLNFRQPLPADDWDEMRHMLLEAQEAIFKARRERFLGPNGSLVADLERALARAGDLVQEDEGLAIEKFSLRNLDDAGVISRLDQVLIELLLILAQTSRTEYDKRTHQRRMVTTSRVNFIYYAASLLEGIAPQEISDQVLHHLQQAQEAVMLSYELLEWQRLGNSSLSALDAATRKLVLELFHDRDWPIDPETPFNSLPPDQQDLIREILGWRALNAVYRQLLLGVISELWVDYLTQMEALRVSIGLEAYAQRDPLVQYKSRASELYNELLSNTRLGVITRMYTYRPRNIAVLLGTEEEPEAGLSFELDEELIAEALPAGENPPPEGEQSQPVNASSDEGRPAGGGKRRRRHRR